MSMLKRSAVSKLVTQSLKICVKEFHGRGVSTRLTPNDILSFIALWTHGPSEHFQRHVYCRVIWTGRTRKTFHRFCFSGQLASDHTVQSQPVAFLQLQSHLFISEPLTSDLYKASFPEQLVAQIRHFSPAGFWTVTKPVIQSSQHPLI